MNTYVPIFRGLDARGGRKLRTDTHTRTTTVTLAARMLIMVNNEYENTEGMAYKQKHANLASWPTKNTAGFIGSIWPSFSTLRTRSVTRRGRGGGGDLLLYIIYTHIILYSLSFLSYPGVAHECSYTCISDQMNEQVCYRIS